MSASLLLSDILRLGSASSGELQRWLDGADAALADRIRVEAERRGEGAAQFLRIAVADFLAEADEEAWADVLSASRDAADPGAAFVSKMTAFRIRLETAS